MVLKLNRYFVESNYPDIIRRLLNDSVLKQALISDTQLSETGNPAETSAVTIKEEANAFTAIITVDQEDERDEDPVDHDGAQPSSSAVKAEGETDFTSSFEIHRSMVEDVRKRCVELDYPLTEEYDFRGDTANASLEIDLSPKCIIRDVCQPATTCLTLFHSSTRKRVFPRCLEVVAEGRALGSSYFPPVVCIPCVFLDPIALLSPNSW